MNRKASSKPSPSTNYSTTLHHGNGSPLSALSPAPSSFESDEAQYCVNYTWSGAISAVDNPLGVNEEVGLEVSASSNGNDSAQDVKSEFAYGPTPGPGYEATPRAGGGASRCATTPKAGTANRQRDATPKMGSSKSSSARRHPSSSTSTAGVGNQKSLSPPSWDISQTFSFRAKTVMREQDLRTHPEHQSTPKSPSSFSGIWDGILGTIGLSRSGSVPVEKEDNTVQPGSSNDSSDGNNEVHALPPDMSESQENDLFAAEVGLMFSVDEGDTIHDPSAISANFTNSFTIESENSAQHPPAYSLEKYLQHRHDSSDPVTTFDDTTKGDEVTNCTTDQSTVRDEHGNQVPQNAKMILGYDNVKRRKTGKQWHGQSRESFPTIQKSDSTPEEMERRLRDLAGQVNPEWRGSDYMPPALARRLRDFQFAREKRRKKYGEARPWGILGLYDHLSAVKIDVEWAEDAAWRRTNKQPYLTWFDFEETKKGGHNRPYFTFLVISACTAMMFTSFLVNDWSFEPLSVNPMVGPSAETLISLGAKDSYLIVEQNEGWRLVSPMVLHAGLIHFILNMFALWFVGKAIEQIHGFFPASVVFVVPAIGGVILSAIFLPEYITVGASGGIFGLMGACTADIIMNWNLLFNKFVNEPGARISHAKVLIVLFFDMVLNCLIGLTPFVDNFTHLGGMVYGLLCGLSTIQLVSPKFLGNENGRCHKCKIFFYRSFGLLVCMGGVVASSFVLFSGDGVNNPCTSCKYMSCVSFPPWAARNEKWWYCDECDQASAEGKLETDSGKFIELLLTCPNNEDTETLAIDESWPQTESGLEGILPSLCREHCF